MTSDPHEINVDQTELGAPNDALDDLPITCIDCRTEFIWSAGERKFFFEKGLINPPKRCKPCKKAKNARVEAALSGNEGPRARITVKVQCASCQVETTVPFYPSQGRPVLCRDCFKNK